MKKNKEVKLEIKKAPVVETTETKYYMLLTENNEHNTI